MVIITAITDPADASMKCVLATSSFTSHELKNTSAKTPRRSTKSPASLGKNLPQLRSSSNGSRSWAGGLAANVKASAQKPAVTSPALRCLVTSRVHDMDIVCWR